MTYAQISHSDFSRAMQKLTQANLPVKSAYEIKKLADKIMDARRRIGTEYEDVITPWTKKNEDGSVFRPEGAPGGWDILDEHIESFKAFSEKFGANEIVIERQRISLGVLGNVQLSASDLAAIEQVVDFGDEERAPAAVIPLNA